MTMTTPTLDQIEVPRRGTQEQVFDVLVWGGLIILLVWSFVPSEMHRIGNLLSSGGNMGIRATGASRVQEIFYGVIPQVMPLWISFSLYRFEANVRSATVLGFVGAGGSASRCSRRCASSTMPRAPRSC